MTNKIWTDHMMYTIKDEQLLVVWKIIQGLGEIRKLSDAMERSEVLTNAEALLIALVLELKPLPRDHSNHLTLTANGYKMSPFDA